MQRQLSIFDTLQPLDTAESKVKSGDFVKLRRKSASAAYWKKGEIVQIESVHPIDGSGRFWNERSESWAYLQPDDMTKTLPPIDILSPSAIALGTESKVVNVEIDSVPGVDVGTESKVVNVEIDSVPGVDVGTESNCQPEEIDSVPSPVNRYRPKGTARGGEYYRFSYRAGEKRKNVHIPGGNTGSVLAQSRAAEVMELAAVGVPSLEICEHIKRWSTRRHLETE